MQIPAQHSVRELLALFGIHFGEMLHDLGHVGLARDLKVLFTFHVDGDVSSVADMEMFSKFTVLLNELSFSPYLPKYQHR